MIIPDSGDGNADIIGERCVQCGKELIIPDSGDGNISCYKLEMGHI